MAYSDTKKYIVNGNIIFTNQKVGSGFFRKLQISNKEKKIKDPNNCFFIYRNIYRRVTSTFLHHAILTSFNGGGYLHGRINNFIKQYNIKKTPNFTYKSCFKLRESLFLENIFFNKSQPFKESQIFKDAISLFTSYLDIICHKDYNNISDSHLIPQSKLLISIKDKYPNMKICFYDLHDKKKLNTLLNNIGVCNHENTKHKSFYKPSVHKWAGWESDNFKKQYIILEFHLLSFLKNSSEYTDLIKNKYIYDIKLIGNNIDKNIILKDEYDFVEKENIN